MPILLVSVVDPDSLNPDPVLDADPVFQVNPDTVPDMDTDPGFWWPKIEEDILLTAIRNIYIWARDKLKLFSFSFFEQKLKFTFSWASIQDVQATGEAKENIQHFKRWNLLNVYYFSGSFLPTWIRIRIANPDLDPGTPLNPDPQHCCLVDTGRYFLTSSHQRNRNFKSALLNKTATGTV